MKTITKFMLVATFALAAGVTSTATAQNHMQTSRAFVQSPHILAMGDAGVALGSRETAFFYNPAAFAFVSSRPAVAFTLPKATIGNDLFGKIRFYRDDIQPAIDEGMDNMSASELNDLYNRTFLIAQQRTTVNLDVTMPAVTFNVSGVGVGAGLFAHSTASFAVGDAGAGVPLIDALGRADFIAVASAGLDFSQYGVQGLAAGLTSKYTSRYLTLKRKPLDAFGSEEAFHLLRGNSVGFDLGLLYDIQQVPGLRAGLAIYDFIASDFDFQFANTLGGDNPNQASLDAELAIAQEFALEPSYRLGASYAIPAHIAGPMFAGSVLALDYVDYGDPRVDQVFLAKIHMGGELLFLNRLAFRAGVGQGYTSIGGGARLGFLRLDYAFFGQEHGRLPGRMPSWNHTAQMSFSF